MLLFHPNFKWATFCLNLGASFQVVQGLGFWSCLSLQSLSSLWLCHLLLIEQSQCNLIYFHVWSEKGQKRGTSTPKLTGAPKYCSTHVSTRLSQDMAPYRIVSFHGARAALLSHTKSAEQDRHRKTTFPFFSRHLMGKMLYTIFPPLDSPRNFPLSEKTLQAQWFLRFIILGFSLWQHCASHCV